MVAHYLVELGHCRCASVGDSDVPEYAIHISDLRLAGYRQGLREAGLDLPEHYISRAPHGLESARRQAHALLDLPSRRPRSSRRATHRLWAC